MDPTSSQTPMSGMHHASVANSLPPEYWNTFDSFYPGPAPQQQQPQRPQQPTPPRQPLGISWDHPVFQQQRQQSQRSQIPRHQEHNHGIYSSPAPQSWQSNHLNQSLLSSTPQDLGIPQYSQVNQFPQSQLPFDPQPSIPSDTAPFEPLSFSQDFFSPSQQLSMSETFPQPSSQQTAPPQPTSAAAYQSSTCQTPMTPYTMPAGFPEEASHTPINFPNGFSEPVNQQTINPQFLDAPPQSVNQQHASVNNNFLYLSPADFERPGNPKPFNYFHNELQMSSMNQPIINNQTMSARNSGVDVVITGHGPSLAPKPAQQSARLKKSGASNQLKHLGKKAVSGKQANEKSSSSSSDSDSDINVQVQPPEESSPLPPTRPNEPLAAARYDALHAVWSPRNRRPNADKVKNALVAFKDVVKAVRDTWKEHTQAMKTAENQGENDKADQLKKEVVLQRCLMDVVVSSTLEMGHPMIVEKLGEHPMAIAAMYSFLLDRHQAADIDGTLTVNILKLLSHFATIDEDVLQKTNVAKLLPRFLKKGKQPVKDLAKEVQDNASASTKRKQEASKSGSKEGSPGKSPPDSAIINGSRVEAVGWKRPREEESNGEPAAKRVVVNSNNSNIKNPSKPGTTGNGLSAKRPQEAGQDAKATATTTRPKANIVAPKPTNLFGSLGSASKRPGTSNAERAAAAAAAKTNTPTEKKKETPPAPPKPTISFGDIMADLNKQKDTEPAEPVEDKPPETKEEQEKRVRKESRRKLRVSWKPDHSLTEVRLFTHDPEEELGPRDRSQRQAGDVKGEGRVLKLHKDIDELGEEDEGGIREENLLNYREPSGMESSRPEATPQMLMSLEMDIDITPDDRARNYIKRGGTQEPTSPETKAQEHREATTLMVFYTSLADIPPSPKEPPPPSEDGIIPDPQSFGDLPDHVKARQERYYSFINPKPAPAAQQNAPNNQFDISNLLKIIQNASQQQQPQQPVQPTQPFPQPQPVSQAATSDLERTVNMFRQQQQQQQQPQAPPALSQMPQFPMPQPSSGQGMDFQKILSVMNAQKQVSQPPVLPQPSQLLPGIAPNLASIISQFSNQNQQTGSNQPSNSLYEDPERKRLRESGGLDGTGDDRFNPTKRNRPNGPHKKHPKIGIVPCRYWREGKCLKGDDCTFRHDPLT